MSDRSEVDCRSTSITGLPAGGVPADDELLAASGLGQSRGDQAGESEHSKDREGEKRHKDMLFVSGMMGVKRRSLGTLR